MKSAQRSRQTGFGLVAVIVLLVMLTALGGAVVALSSTQSSVLSQDVLSSRAEQSARAGVEWGLFQAFSGSTAWDGGANCTTAIVTAPAQATIAALNGFQATVQCWSRRFFEGQNPNATGIEVRVFQITVVACPAGAGTCPRTGANTAGVTYAERRREAVGVR